MKQENLDSATVAVLRARAERLVAAPEEETTEGVFWVAAFGLGDERFGVPLDTMLAVLPLKAVTPVPLAPNEVLGMLRFQGKLIRALSLAALLVGRAVRRDPVALIVVESGTGAVVALDCEHIPIVVGVDRVQATLAAENHAESFSEMTAQDGALLHLLDIDALLKKEGAGGT